MSKLENNSIPVNIADSIIDSLPKELFIDSSKKFCYASIVDDYIIRKLYDKLNEGLKDIIIDEDERKHHILDNMIYGISLSNARTRLVKARSIIKNIYTKNISEDDLLDMPKFDFIIQNPPYNKSLHLDFFNKGLDLLSETGKMVIIEPAQWLIQLKENAKYTKPDSITEKIKKRINEYVYKVNIQNFNNEFGIANKTVISITYIDFSKKYNKIDFTCITEHKLVNSIYDCNLIGENKLVKNILNKALLYKDHMINHCINLKNYIDYENKGYWFIPYGNYMINSLGSNRGRNAEMFYQDDFETHTVSAKTKFGIYYNSFVNVGSGDKIYYNIVPKGVKRGSPYDCIFSKYENNIQNWKYYIRNNKLPLFINICLTIDEHNNSREYIPWLVDKKYTDEEIYKLLDITKEEQELIDKIIEKYERSSVWCRQYMLGPSSVSD